MCVIIDKYYLLEIFKAEYSAVKLPNYVGHINLNLFFQDITIFI